MRYIFWLLILILSFTIYAAQPPQKVRADSLKIGSKATGIDVTVFLKSFGGLIDSVALTGENGYEFWKDGVLVANLESAEVPTYSRVAVFLASSQVWNKDVERNYVFVEGESQTDSTFFNFPYNLIGEGAVLDSIEILVGATGSINITDFQLLADNFGSDSSLAIPAFSTIELSADTITISIDLGGVQTYLPLQFFLESDLGTEDLTWFYIKVYYKL